MQRLDLRKLACPAPVVETKKAVDAGRCPFEVLVDSEAQQDNVSRMARKLGCSVEIHAGPDDCFAVSVNKEGVAPTPSASVSEQPGLSPASSLSGTVVYMNSAVMGSGDDKLGHILIRAFLKTLHDLSPVPKTLIMVNGGVKLAITDANDTVPAIAELEARGTEVLVCGTCLDFFDAKNKLAVGRISNMFEIVEALDAATRIVEP